MSIGQDLLDVPFADLVQQLGTSIAEAQLQMDRTAIDTLKFLVDTKVSVVPEVTDVITPVARSVTVPGTGQVVPYSGAQVTSSGAAPVEMSLFQAGIFPTFYQFSQADIEVKISVTIKQGSQPTSTGDPRTKTPLRVHASPVDYRTANTYSYSADGSSVLRASLRPVPAPSRITPRTVTIDALSQPPRVTVAG